MSHCRYCYGNGHNIRSCPKIKEQAIANPDSWAARKIESYKVDPAKGGNARVCGYCHETGHNRKTCKKIIVDFTEAVKKNSQYRINMLERMKMCGFGVGALVECRYSNNSICTITRINWDNINFNNEFNTNVAVLDEDGYNGFGVSYDKFNILTKSYKDYYLELCSGTSADMISSQVPTGWVNGVSRSIKDKYGVK